MSDNEKWMQLAIQKAKEGVTLGQTPFGSSIVCEDKLVSCEHNIVWQSTDITAHAEIHAIRKACHNLKTIDLSNCIIYSTCEPCPMCFSAIHWARIPVIYYAASIEDAASFGFNELKLSNQFLKESSGSKITIHSQFQKENALEVFHYWKSLQGKSY